MLKVEIQSYADFKLGIHCQCWLTKPTSPRFPDVGDINEVRRNALELRDFETELKRNINGGDLDLLETCLLGWIHELIYYEDREFGVIS